MISRKRGTMAAVTVAILCITMIFSIIPVVAYAADCDHFFIGQGPSATCTDDGYSVQVCQYCGYTDGIVDIIYATGHSFVDGVCEDCGVRECFEHFYALTLTSNGDGTHDICEACNSCGYLLSEGTYSCVFNDEGYCACGYYQAPSSGGSGSNPTPGGSCAHTYLNEYLYNYNNENSHTPSRSCKDCGQEFFYDSEAHTFVDGKCSRCGYLNQAACLHSTIVTVDYLSYGNVDTHTVVKKCIDCSKQFIEPGLHTFSIDSTVIISSGVLEHKVSRMCALCSGSHVFVEKHDFVSGKCSVCGILDSLPDNAISAYVYLDEQGRWVVQADTYIGGVNRLNLMNTNLYFHNKKSVELVSMSANSIVLKDLDGGINSSNSKLVDVNDIYLSKLEVGKEYKFVADVDSPWPDSKILLMITGLGETIYLSPGGTFTYDKSMQFVFNIKLNSSRSKCYGQPFLMEISDIGVVPAAENYEPFGLRYFNNDMSYSLHYSSTFGTSKQAAGLAAFADYLGSIAYKNPSYHTRKDLLLNKGGEHILTGFSGYYDQAYNDLSNGEGDYYAIYKELFAGSKVSYNQGYTDGYGSAVRDFEGVTDGGMVEGMINGAFNSVSDSWDILNSGVSISGISVGGIVSSMVILVVVYIGLKVIAR